MGSNGGRTGRVGGMPTYTALVGPAALRTSHPPTSSTSSTATFLAAASYDRTAWTGSAPGSSDSTTAVVPAAALDSATAKPSAIQPASPLIQDLFNSLSAPPSLLERRHARHQPAATSSLIGSQSPKGRRYAECAESDASLIDGERVRTPAVAWPQCGMSAPHLGASDRQSQSTASASGCRRSPDCPWAFDGRPVYGRDSSGGLASRGSPAKMHATTWSWQQHQQQQQQQQQPTHSAETHTDSNLQPSVSPSDGSSLEVHRLQRTFNMRMVTLANLPPSMASSSRARSAAVQRARAGVTTNAARSLTLLRQTVQQSVTRDVRDVLQRWVRRLFRPAVDALRAQRGDNVAGEEHLNAVCRDILDEVKRSYLPAGSGGGSSGSAGVAGGTRSCGSTPRGSPAPSGIGSSSGRSDLTRSKLVGSQQHHQLQQHPSRATSAVDGTGVVMLAPPRKRGRPRKVQPTVPMSSLMKSDACEAEVVSLPSRLPTYDPAKLVSHTLFITGSRANSALGLGATRGKVYQRHPELFKYAVDQDDRHWLQEQRFIRPAGGATYLMLFEEIRTLVSSSLYRENPTLVPSELHGFEIPDWMLTKVQSHMTYLRRTWSSDARSLAASADGRIYCEPGGAKQRTTNISVASIAGSALTHSVQAQAELIAADDSAVQSESENDVTMPLTVSMLPLIEIEPGDVDLDGVEDDDAIDDGPPDLSLPSD